MTTPFPSPTIPAASRAEVFLRYLEFFRQRVVSKVASPPAQAARSTAIVESHALDEVGQPGERWDGAELAGGETGE